jgi:hypothetical protein
MLIGFDYVAGRFWWLPPPEVPLGLRVIVPIAFAVTGIAVLYFFIENQLAVADALCRYPIDTPVVRELSERGTFPKTVRALRMVRCANKEPDAWLKGR